MGVQKGASTVYVLLTHSDPGHKMTGSTGTSPGHLHCFGQVRVSELYSVDLLLSKLFSNQALLYSQLALSALCICAQLCFKKKILISV